MNLFIIPSWYPTHSNPIAGIFFKEQAEAIAELCPDTQVIVSLRNNIGALSPYFPLQSIDVLKRYLSADSGFVQRHERFCEIYRPTIYWSKQLIREGMNKHHHAHRKNLKAAISKYGRINIIHAHVSYPAGYIAAILSREFNIPYVLTEHMGPFPFIAYLRNGRPMPEIDEAFGQAKRTIAVSPALADRVHSFGYPKPVVIPNMVHEEHFYPDGPTEEIFTFFTLGGLSEQKGTDTLLKAIALLKDSFTKIQFWIAGDGPERDKFHNLANSLNISKFIRWIGPVRRTDVPDLFRRCHVFVLSSCHETFGIVYAEAIASGKPIIATRCGGPEFIVNKENGILVDVGDIPSLATAIGYMIHNWDHYSPERIRKDFESRFSRQAVVGQLHALYEKVTQGQN